MYIVSFSLRCLFFLLKFQKVFHEEGVFMKKVLHNGVAIFLIFSVHIQGALSQHDIKTHYTLMRNAVTIRPDKFHEHYAQLSQEQQCSLLDISKKYGDAQRKSHEGYALLLRLIGDYFPKDIYHRIKSLIGDKDNDEKWIENYCRAQLIASHPFTTVKDRDYNILAEMINLPSLCMKYLHTNEQFKKAIPLYIGNALYHTYASHFIGNNCEYRITETFPTQFLHSNPSSLSDECLLWIIDHKNPHEYAFSTNIKHTYSDHTIKGGCFSKAKDKEIQYVITYSDRDIVITSIDNTIEVDIPLLNAQSVTIKVCTDDIIDVVFDDKNYCLYVASYDKQNMRTLLSKWDMSGNREGLSSCPFKTWGFIERIFLDGDNYLVLVLNMLLRYVLVRFDNMQLVTYSTSYEEYLVSINNSCFVYNPSFHQFAGTEKCVMTYSPDGKFLLCNSFTKNFGLSYITTCIKDARNHQIMYSTDTLYKSFIGVGFTHDSKQLIFLSAFGSASAKNISTDQDEQALAEFNSRITEHSGTAVLIKNLAMQCAQKGKITLSKDNPIRKMLQEWYNSSENLKYLLGKYFPLNKV